MRCTCRVLQCAVRVVDREHELMLLRFQAPQLVLDHFPRDQDALQKLVAHDLTRENRDAARRTRTRAFLQVRENALAAEIVLAVEALRVFKDLIAVRTHTVRESLFHISIHEWII